MPGISPEDVKVRMHERASRHRSSVPWLQTLILVGALGVLGWFGYQHWLHRLPQDRALALNNGTTINGRLLARNFTILKVQLSDTGEALYLPIAVLSAADQDFARHLAESKLEINFPVASLLVGPPQSGMHVKFLGRTEDMVKYQEASSGTVYLTPLAELSAVDQGFLHQLHQYMPKDNETEHTFTTKAGQTFTGTILGQNKGALSYRLTSDNTMHYFPTEDLSPEDQRFLNSNSPGLRFEWPLDCTVYDNKGIPEHVNVKGRVANYVMLMEQKTGEVVYRPMSDFSLEDQKVFLLLDASPLPKFPFEFTLTDTLGRSLPVVIEGRTDLDVKIRLANGTITTYPLNKLSLTNQDFLRTLSGEFDSHEIKMLRDRISTLELENLKLRAKIADPTISTGERSISSASLNRNLREIESAKISIDAYIKDAELDRIKNAAKGKLP